MADVSVFYSYCSCRWGKKQCSVEARQWENHCERSYYQVSTSISTLSNSKTLQRNKKWLLYSKISSVRINVFTMLVNVQQLMASLILSCMSGKLCIAEIIFNPTLSYKHLLIGKWTAAYYSDNKGKISSFSNKIKNVPCKRTITLYV